MTFSNARSVAPGVSSTSTSRAMSMKRRDSSGSSAFSGGAGLRDGMDISSYVERRPVGKNDFGAPEDQIMDITRPLIPPDGMVGVFRDCQTDDVFDSDGTTLWSPSLDRVGFRRCHLPHTRVVQFLGMLPRNSSIPSLAEVLGYRTTSNSLPGWRDNPKVANGPAGVIPPGRLNQTPTREDR